MVIVVVAHRNIDAAANSVIVSRIVWSHYQNVIITYLVQDTKSNDLTVQIYYSFNLRELKKISNEISMSITRPYSKITKKRRRGGGSLTYHIFIFTVISLQSNIGYCFGLLILLERLLLQKDRSFLFLYKSIQERYQMLKHLSLEVHLRQVYQREGQVVHSEHYRRLLLHQEG
jgi:hypothetical protein